MQVERAEYYLEDGYPVLKLIIDGKPAYLFEIKKTLLDLGLVYLISETNGYIWDDNLPPISMEARPETGTPAMTFRGVTDDRVVVGLARDYWETTNGKKEFRIGPVDLSLFK